MGKINDLDLGRWREYEDILTSSLWVLGKRDKSGGHKGDYHGNFAPQIPNQLMRRFTKRGEVVLDVFLGSGTTLIECRRLGRSGIGVELLSEVAELARQRILQELDSGGFCEVLVGDAVQRETRCRVEEVLHQRGRRNVQLLIFHPPYHDVIRFSDRAEDLSNVGSLDAFLKLFGEAVSNFWDLLEEGRYLAVVMGDKYAKSEWIPLGFLTMQEVLRRCNPLLKGILIKNVINNRGKRNQWNLWRYRALAGGFYLFGHEYIFLFQKRSPKKRS